MKSSLGRGDVRHDVFQQRTRPWQSSSSMLRSLLAQAGMFESLAVDSRGPTLSAGPGRPSGAGMTSCERQVECSQPR